MVGFKVDENLNLRLGEETKNQQVENTIWEGWEWSDVRFRASWWQPSPMSIKDRIMLGLNEQVLIMYWHMWDLWGPVNQLAFVTAWSNCNRYPMVDVWGRMR
jgi:hypothetical protein